MKLEVPRDVKNQCLETKSNLGIFIYLHMQVHNGTGPCVRRSVCPLLAYRKNFMETSYVW